MVMRRRLGRSTTVTIHASLCIVPSVAVTLATPRPFDETNPQESTVTTVSSEDCHCTRCVTSTTLPSDSVAVAYIEPCWPRSNCDGPPATMRPMSTGTQPRTQTCCTQSSHAGQLDTQMHRSPGWLQVPASLHV